MAPIHHGMVTCLTSILESSKYSDMTVRCGSEEFKLHRAIVCPRSEFFAAACDGQFKEVNTSIIVLEEDDPPTVRRMFSYLYTLAYDDEGDAASPQHYMVDGTNIVISQALTPSSTPIPAEEVSRHVRMMNNVVVYAIAEKYDIAELKELAADKFRKLLWLIEPSHALPRVIDAVYKIKDSELRDVVVQFCANNSTKIVADDRLCRIIKYNGELGLDVLRKVDNRASKNLRERILRDRKLLALKKDLAQMLETALASSVFTLQQKLQAAHDNIMVLN